MSLTKNWPSWLVASAALVCLCLTTAAISVGMIAIQSRPPFSCKVARALLIEAQTLHNSSSNGSGQQADRLGYLAVENAKLACGLSGQVVGEKLMNETGEQEVTRSRKMHGQRHSTMGRKKRATDRGRPILNEFSFPANLVQGMRYVLMCQVLDGEPPIQIKWFKDNLDLSLSVSASGAVDSSSLHSRQTVELMDSIEMQSNDELSSSLLFRKVKQQHGGNYTCLATNHLGSSTYSSLMTVKVPPSWRIEPKDQEAIMGELVTIDCQASGNPNPFIRWKFTNVQHDKMWQPGQFTGDLTTASSVPLSTITNNFKLINSNHHVQTLENGSLTIRQTGIEHEGLYLCEADNGVEPNLIKQIRLVVHRQAHFVDDIQIQLQDHSSGASSVVSSSTSSGQQQQQQQQQSSLGTQNVPIAPVKSIKLAQNSTLVRLICMPYGDAPLQLDWLKDGRLIHTHSSNGPSPSSSSSSPSSSSSSSAVAISNGIIDHQATATSSMATSPSVADQQHLSQTMGRYHVNTRWLSSNQQKFLATPQHQQQHSMGSLGFNGLESELLLTNLARHDAGLYTCSARNAFGQSERKLRIIVQEQPEPPAMVDVARISSRFISLRWLAPFDGNSAITKYVIEYRKQRAAGVSHDPTPAAMNSNADDFFSELFAVSRSEKIMSGSSVALKQSASYGSLDQQQQQQQSAVQLTTGGAQIQHTVHDLEPMTRYSMRVIAVNALGASRPSVSLSLRTEEEVPASVPTLVEANVLSSRSIKIRWTISYPMEHELIDGFFIGYRSFDSALAPSTPDNMPRPSIDLIGGSDAGKGALDNRPTFTYKTIRLTNQQQQQQQTLGESLRDSDSSSDVTPMLSPISSVTKSVPIDTLTTGNQALSNSIKSLANSNQQATSEVAYVISNFEYVINGLERNTEYTVLIQCFNKKGAGPSSDAIVAKTLMSDPPEKLTLIGEDLSETSLRLSWQFRGEPPTNRPLLTGGPTASANSNPVDGFVLTFAKLARLHSGKSNQRKLSAADSAARISQQQPPVGNNNQHLYSAPIQPSQIVDHQWHTIQLAPQQRGHVLKNLECGTLYAFKIWAFNQIGKGEPSDLVTLSTRGKRPIAPARRSLLTINSTEVRLRLNAWYDGGCEINKFSIQYRPRTSQARDEWTLVSDNIPREQGGNIVIRDLTPSTSYELLVGAQNHVDQTEAKYRFTTHDADGKPSSRASSFLGVGGDDDDDNDNDGDQNGQDDEQPIDYLDDLGAIREHYKSRGGGGDGGSLQVYHSQVSGGATRWLLAVRQILNSPLTLLLAFCLFLVLLVLLIFNRFNSSSSQSSSSSSARFGGPGGGGAQNGNNNNNKSTCSVDGELPMSMANGSPQLTDSPATRVNLAANSNSHSNYAPLDSYYAPNGSFCQSAQQSTVLPPLIDPNNDGTYQQRPHNCQPIDNYAPLPVTDYYSPSVAAAAATYAPSGVHRSVTMTDTTVDSSSMQVNAQEAQDEQRQQYLMQMLMMSPQQQQQHNSNTLARPQQNVHNNSYSMTAAALTTLARHGQKSGLMAIKPSTNNYSDPMFQSNNFTLGRQMQPPTTFQHADNVNAVTTSMTSTSPSDEAYPMSTFLGSRSRNQQQQQQDLLSSYGYSKETTTTTASSFNNSAASTSGCGTAGTSSTTSHLGGLSDILELHSPCCDEPEANLVQLDDNITKDFQIQTLCDKPTTGAATGAVAADSHYDVPFKFKATTDRKC